jgi:hypothetical protein
VASKPEAARWAIGALGQRWSALIAAAQAYSPGVKFDHLDETVGLIQFTLQKWGLPVGDI